MELMYPTHAFRVTGDHDLQPIAGNYDKFVGKVQQGYGDQKDELMTWTDRWHRKSTPDAIKKEKAGNQMGTGIAKKIHHSGREKIMNSHNLRTLCVALVVGVTFIAAPATAADMTEEKGLITDSWLTAKTKIALFADARVKGRQIDVETTNGQVMLRGMVDSDTAKQAAEDITKELDGVKSVKNDLEVIAPSTREAVEEKDEAITERVEAEIAKDWDMKNSEISVQTNAGVVSLTGEVSDIMTSANASWTAWQVPGVKSVKNDITVKEKA